MQDLIQQSERRSVRNISIDKPKALVEEQNGPSPLPTEPRPQQPMPPVPPRPQFGVIGDRSSGGINKKWFIIGGGVLVALLVLIAWGAFFNSAKITISPRESMVNLESTFVASLDPAPGMTGLEMITVTKEAQRTVQATGSEKIERPASGTIIVYNDMDSEPQKLIKNTRFQTPEGLVFRIQESITIPGQRTDAGGATVPGSVEVKVFADSVGAEYNIGLTDFTIPGFKEGGDMERFEKFYARSKTEMTGGFSGTIRVASKEDTTAAETAMKTELAEALVAEAGAGLPQGFVIVPESGSFTYETLPNADGDEGSVVITVRGEGKVLAVNTLDVARATATDRVPGYTGEPVAFVDPSTVAFSLVNGTFDPAATSTSVRASGPATLTWTFDIDELKEKLAGQSRSTAKMVFGDYPGIERADMSVQPFWKQSLPDDVADIAVTIEKLSQ